MALAEHVSFLFPESVTFCGPVEMYSLMSARDDLLCHSDFTLCVVRLNRSRDPFDEIS